MRITLFWPLYPIIIGSYPQTPSIGMQYLSKILSVNGFEVTVIDCDMVLSRDEIRNFSDRTIEKLIKMIENTNPDILAVGSYTVAMPIVAELTRAFKVKNPDIPIILGGTNPTFLPEETLKLLPHVNYLVRGEGEYTLLELVQKLTANKSVNKVKGISYRNNRKIVHTPNRSQIRNLNDLPLIDLEHFIIKNKFTYSFMWNRGCICDCSFCNVKAMWGDSRSFSPRYIVNLIKHILDLYPNVNFAFNTDNLFSNMFWVKKVAELIHKELPDFKWGGSGTVLPITEELINFLKIRGLSGLFIGVESIIPQSLIFFNKTRNPSFYIKKVYEVLEIIEKSNVWADLGFIGGAPNESKQDLLRLKEFIIKINDEYINIRGDWQHLILFPGTKLWYHYLDKKFKIQKIPLEIRDSWIPKIIQKYDNFVWLSPYSYIIENNNLSINELIDIFLKCINDIGYLKNKK